MYNDKKVPELVINKLTKAQYDSAEKNPDELYLVKDAKITADDLDEEVLVDFVKKTDYANTSTGGVIKTGAAYGTQMASSGVLTSVTRTYDQYMSGNNAMFIGKATLENVIEGKGLVASEEATRLKVVTKEEYEALTPANDTIYFIKEV